VEFRALDKRGLTALASGHAVADLCQGAVPALIPFLIAVSLVLSPLVIWLYLEALTYFRRSK